MYKSPQPAPFLSHRNPVHVPNPYFEDPFWCYLPIYAWVFKVVSFRQVYPSEPYICISSSPYVLYATPILFILDLITRMTFFLTTIIIYCRIPIIVQKVSYFLNCAGVTSVIPHYCSRIYALVLNCTLSGSLVSAGFNSRIYALVLNCTLSGSLVSAGFNRVNAMWQSRQ